VKRLDFTVYRLGYGSFFLGILLSLTSGAPGTALAAPDGPPERPDPPAVLVRLTPVGALRQGSRLGLDGSRVGPSVLAVEAPFAGFATGAEGIEEPLFRIRRLLLAPGAGAAAVAAGLRGQPGIEDAWVERRFRVSWAEAGEFLTAAPRAPLPGAAAPAGGQACGPGDGIVLFAPDDPQFVDGTQWGLRNTGAGPFGGQAGVDIRAEAGWEVTTGSTSTAIAIVDTGLDLGHPELAGLLAGGGPRIVAAYNSSVEPPGASAWDSVGHGTIVAGVALARTNNGPQLDGRGVAGVAGGAGGDSAGCRVLAIKATPTSLLDALSSELAEGIVYAVTRGARAINLSFGGDEDDDTIRSAISFAARRGCVVVCGAGNGQDERPQYPGYYARYGGGISVAALDSDGALARFSSRGPQIDVAAPGDEIQSTYLTYANAFQSPLRNYTYSSGTSFAAPFVTGLAGLTATLQPSLTDNEFQQLLRHTARDLGAPGRDDTYGWGIPDAGALLGYAAPPRGFVRGERARAQTWALAGTDSVTLSKTGIVINGCNADGRYLAERWEVRTRIELEPGRLLETPLGMARVHSTRGWTAGPLLEYDLGHGEVVPGSASPGGFTLRTWVYRIEASPIFCSSNVGSIGWVPSRPESVHFGWSAFGRIDAPPALAITAPAADGGAWSVDDPETLRWEASDPDQLSGFFIELSIDGGATWRFLGALPPGARQLAFRSPCGPEDAVYRVRVRAVDAHGLADETTSVRLFRPSRACVGDETPGGPPPFALFPVVPNPARGSVQLRFSRAAEFVALTGPEAPTEPFASALFPATIAVYDVRGRQVRSLPVPETPTGTIVWDGRDAGGRRLPPGVYLARLHFAPQGSFAQRFVLLPP
jgi:hypothetical protein